MDGGLVIGFVFDTQIIINICTYIGTGVKIIGLSVHITDRKHFVSQSWLPTTSSNNTK